MDNGCNDIYGEAKLFFFPFGYGDVISRDVPIYKHSPENTYLTQIE